MPRGWWGKSSVHSATFQVRPGRLLRRHQPCVKPSGSGISDRNFRIIKMPRRGRRSRRTQTVEARIINILDFFGSSESSLQDVTTVDRASIWAGDGVHLAHNAIRVAAMKLMQNIANGGVSAPALAVGPVADKPTRQRGGRSAKRSAARRTGRP